MNIVALIKYPLHVLVRNLTKIEHNSSIFIHVFTILSIAAGFRRLTPSTSLFNRFFLIFKLVFKPLIVKVGRDEGVKGVKRKTVFGLRKNNEKKNSALLKH